MSEVFLKIHDGDPGPNLNQHLIRGTGLPRWYSLTKGGDVWWSTGNIEGLHIKAVTMWDCTGQNPLSVLDLPAVNGHSITFPAALMAQALTWFRAALNELCDTPNR